MIRLTVREDLVVMEVAALFGLLQDVANQTRKAHGLPPLSEDDGPEGWTKQLEKPITAALEEMVPLQQEEVSVTQAEERRNLDELIRQWRVHSEIMKEM